MTKVCHACKEEKDIDEFSNRTKAKDGKHTQCKTCSRKYTQRHYKENIKYYVDKSKVTRDSNREYVWEFLQTQSCKDCGNINPLLLEFDHLDDFEKDGNISTMIGAVGKETLVKEIEKCEVVCANCHRIRTYRRQNSWCYQQWMNKSRSFNG